MTEREKIIKAIYGAPDRPLKIGNIEIPCYVLEDERRVLVQGGMIQALDISHGGSGSRGGDRLAKFTHQDRLKSFISNEVLVRTENPIRFRTTTGSLAYGYEAEDLAKICFAVLDAAKNKKLQKQQEHIVRQCEILVRGFAIVGINALVDEATGYQAIRTKEALAKILEKYIAKEVREWTKTFPDDFYREMFRLKGWSMNDLSSIKRPSVIGHYTNDVIYRRLAPGVLKALREINPTIKPKYRKQKHFQWLTGDVGNPALARHLHAVMGLMRASTKWGDFIRLLNRSFPRLGDTGELLLDDVE